MPINELRSITIFAKTVQLGSLRKVAESQGITPQAASQALAQLEKHLGVRLFHRTTRSMSMTDAGRTFHDMAVPALTALQHALEITRQTTDGMAGPLKIVGPRAVFAPVFWPLFDEYCRLHPEVEPDVELDDRLGNWVEDRVDVGFRIGASPAEGVIARKLFPIQLIICAAPAYLAKYGAPETVADLADHRCTSYRSANTARVLPWRIKVDGQIAELRVAASLCVNDEELETATVLAGHAVGQLTGIAAATHIRAGNLVPLFTDHLAEPAHAFVYYGSRAAQPVRVRAFIDLAVKRLADNPNFVLTPEEFTAAEIKGRAAVSKAFGGADTT